LVFGLSDHQSTGGAQPFEHGIHVIDVNPEAEAILAGRVDSADADAGARSGHGDVVGFAFSREPIRLGEPQGLIECPRRRNAIDVDDGEGSFTHRMITS
jgi:hypothetical protein